MGRVRRGGYIIEWWMGDHHPRHVHVYRYGREVAKVSVPDLLLLRGKMTGKLKRILNDLISEGGLCAKTKLKTVNFSNRRRELYLTYSCGKKVTLHFGMLGIEKEKIASAQVDKETGGKSAVLEFANGNVDYLPYDQPLQSCQRP